jgi:hypothetical protein
MDDQPIIAERLSARQIIPRRISRIVCMYVCMYVSVTLRESNYFALRANVNITCASVTLRNLSRSPRVHVIEKQ